MGKTKPGDLARAAVHRAVASGKLPPASTQLCAHCGTHPAEHYHHESYEREDWLKVIPLCATCHTSEHYGVVIEIVSNFSREKVNCKCGNEASIFNNEVGQIYPEPLCQQCYLLDYEKRHPKGYVYIGPWSEENS
ncbi:MAG: hypothetical protein L6R45_10450 [Anaerolineae bacterium]|nr:hypothetical protein [Anaerolineae bacterium]